MALPKLNEVPQHELVIPSTGQQVRYRPFLVKEQKVLIMALESQDQRHMLQTILNCIDACVEGIDVNRLATFDVEYIFTQIRTKSVGETTKVYLPCTKCEERQAVPINLEEIKLSSESNPSSTIVELTPEISVELKYPSYTDFLKSEPTQDVNMVFDMMGSCIDAVIVGEERMALKDETSEEVENFMNSLNNEQFEKIRSFVEGIPKISLPVHWMCEACGHENNRKLEGLTDFFS